jgi:hypothetical protein
MITIFKQSIALILQTIFASGLNAESLQKSALR